MDRIIILGGKGGVGKSSISAATAVKVSELLPNKKILIISFDMAHNLSDLFEKPIGNKLTKLKSNLWGIEPDPDEYAEKYTKSLIDKMKTLMKQMPVVGFIPQIEDFIDTTFTPDSIPLALKNAMFFQKILDAEDLTQEIQFDIIVADFPPTGNMIALFEIPEDQVKVVLKYSLNFYNSIKGAVKNVSRVFRNLVNPLGDHKKREELGEEIVNMVEDLEKRGERITELIHRKGSLRLVTIPEKPSFEEIKRARDLTQKYVNLDGVHINLITPEKYSLGCEFCQNIRSNQLKYIKKIENEFERLRIWSSKKLLSEPVGLEGLKLLADEVYGKEIDVNTILYPK
ncbi:MAG: AAA family ATPase [Candidatus Lokiarchaeota archaeon]|nr:AAA family ATPase [Candidatus Lokiarchaeota archaeon]MBD3199927.1 AAA family ATPase [Candidatus Lokiarchaeota archaeon]